MLQLCVMLEIHHMGGVQVFAEFFPVFRVPAMLYHKATRFLAQERKPFLSNMRSIKVVAVFVQLKMLLCEACTAKAKALSTAGTAPGHKHTYRARPNILMTALVANQVDLISSQQDRPIKIFRENRTAKND